MAYRKRTIRKIHVGDLQRVEGRIKDHEQVTGLVRVELAGRFSGSPIRRCEPGEAGASASVIPDEQMTRIPSGAPMVHVATSCVAKLHAAALSYLAPTIVHDVV